MGKTSMRLLCAALTLMLLAGCAAPEAGDSTLQADPNLSWAAEDGPIPAQWTGIYQQGVQVTAKCYAYSATGVYYLTGTGFVIYCDHGSDTFSPLCSRPDCLHAGQSSTEWESCDAYFGFAESIGFYGGHLYVDCLAGDGISLIRAKPDGTDRVTVLQDTKILSAYSGFYGARFVNGTYSILLSAVDDTGAHTEQAYYCKLGALSEGLLPTQRAAPYSHGDALLVDIPHEGQGNGIRGIGLWDADSNSYTYLADLPAEGSLSYKGVSEGYLLRENILCRYDYASGSVTPVFDPGLEGACHLHCFSDCFVLMRSLSDNPDPVVARQAPCEMVFYSWNYVNLGSVTVDIPKMRPQDTAVICAETPERLYLASGVQGVPQYYIEKAELGTGSIQVHALNMPCLWELDPLMN